MFNRHTKFRASLITLALATASGHTALAAGHGGAIALPQVEDPYFKSAEARIARAPAPAHARNVILFIGDGMGIATVTAARIRAGQLKGVDGESYNLTLDSFPHTGFSRTYSHDNQVADSASTITAITTGVKTRSGVIGLSSAIKRDSCNGPQDGEVRTLFEIAEARGLATGVVTTARITHATPAGVYAHTSERNWEGFAADGVTACPDIAQQLVQWPFGDGLEIAMGGGREAFLPVDADDPEGNEPKARRQDGQDLTRVWLGKSPGRRYIWNSSQFAQTNFNSDIQVLGLFAPSHMAYEEDRAQDKGGEPSIAEMTRASIQRLSREKKGYVLMIEGGRIDHAHHAGNARRALSETIAMDEAIKAALDMTDPKDTLIIVTADHSHTLTIAGYAARNNPILGMAGLDEDGKPATRDGKPYSTLGYANGPGSVFLPSGDSPVGGRPDPSEGDPEDLEYRQQSLVPMNSETHGGEDVPIFAWGPGADQVAGTMEENTLFLVMARALGFKFH